MQSSLGNIVLRTPVTFLNSGSKLVAYYRHHKASPSFILLYCKHVKQRESSSGLLPDAKTLLVAHQVILRLGASPCGLYCRYHERPQNIPFEES